MLKNVIKEQDILNKLKKYFEELRVLEVGWKNLINREEMHEATHKLKWQ